MSAGPPNAGPPDAGPPAGSATSASTASANPPAEPAETSAAPLSTAAAPPPAGHLLIAPTRPGAAVQTGEPRAVRLRKETAQAPSLGRATGRAQPRAGRRRPAGPALARRSSIAAMLRAVRQSLPGNAPSGPVRRRARSIGLGRLLTWELAAATLIASIGRPRTVTIAAIAAVTCAVVATTVRIRGRLLYQWLARAARYLLRPHQAQLAAGDLTAEDLIDHLADHPSVETIDLDGIPVAFIHQADGVATVLELQIPDDFGHPDPAALPWAARTSVASLLPAPDADAPLFAAKLIMQTTPTPNLGARSGDAGRRVWITVQAVRTADIHADDDLSLALANAVQRMIRRLAREDVPTRTFDREETLSLVSALSHLDGIPDTEPPRLDETWAAWQAGSAVHACFRIRHWPDADQAVRAQILRRLHLIPSRGTTIAIAARRQTRQVPADGQLLVRITESDRARLENSASLLAFAFEDLAEDVGLERFDGDHVAAVASSLPLNAQALPR